eukprot:6987607-Pyramimonas_sp.AAC.1
MNDKSPEWTMLFQAFLSGRRASCVDRNRLVRAVHIEDLVKPSCHSRIRFSRRFFTGVEIDRSADPRVALCQVAAAAAQYRAFFVWMLQSVSIHP